MQIIIDGRWGTSGLGKFHKKFQLTVNVGRRFFIKINLDFVEFIAQQ
jgi:hypothetical protein